MRRRTARFALAADDLELAVEHGHALLNPAPVDFEFGFAGAAAADSAAKLREIRSDADQVRLPVAQLREFDLKLTFAAARVPGEDIEDQHRAVDDRQRNDLLEVLALARPQVVEHEQQLGVEFLGQVGDLVRLPAADQRRWIDVVAALDDAIENTSAGGFGERFEFDQFRFDWTFPVAGIDGDDESGR